MQKILVVQSPYYQKITNMLLDGVTEELNKNVNIQYDVMDVPGALEIPAAISMANKSKKYDGFIALGCVIRGETSHYNEVTMQSAHGLNILAINEQVAVGNGIITVENEKQALVRADKLQKNKGGFAAKTCLRMMEIKNSLL